MYAHTCCWAGNITLAGVWPARGTFNVVLLDVPPVAELICPPVLGLGEGRWVTRVTPGPLQSHITHPPL